MALLGLVPQVRETPRIYRPLEDLEEDSVRRQCIVSLAHKSELQRDLVAIERRKSEKAEREPLLVVFGVGARVNGQWCRRRYLLPASTPVGTSGLATGLRRGNPDHLYSRCSLPVLGSWSATNFVSA